MHISTIERNAQPAKQQKESASMRIQKQIDRLVQEQKSLSEQEGLSPEQKKEKRQALEDEIAQLRQQLTKAQMDEKKAENEKKAEEVRKAAEKNKKQLKSDEEKKNESGLTTDQSYAFLEASSSMEEARAINHVKVQKSGMAHGLKGQIAVMKSRGENTAAEEAQLAGLEQEIVDLAGDIAAKYGKASKAIENSLKQSIEGKEEKKKLEKKEEEKEDSMTSRGPDDKESEQEKLEELREQEGQSKKAASIASVDIKV